MAATAPPSAPANSSSPSANKRDIRPSLVAFRSSQHHLTGLAPSLPSLRAAEASASHAPYSNSPQPSTCPTAAARHSLPLSCSFSSDSFPISPASSSPSTTPSSPPASQRHRRIQSSPAQHHCPRPRAVHFAETEPPSGASTTRHPYFCHPKPFARNNSAPTTSLPPSSPSTSPPKVSPDVPATEDLNDFERRLTQGLAQDFAELSLLHEATLLDQMNLARSFTKRLARPTSPESSLPSKSSRPQISVPMGLISTTNQWVHDVPNISDLHIKEVQQRQISSCSSHSSVTGSDDSDASPFSEPPSMTDSSSVESLSPVEPNHLTRYFTPSADPAVEKTPSIITTTALPPTPPSPQEPAAKPEADVEQDTESHLFTAPVLPRRAPSHSKLEHERLAHARSVSVRSSTISASERQALANSSQHSSLTTGLSSLQAEPTSTDTPLPLKSSGSRPPSAAEPAPTSSEPFSNELKQLDEVAEEFGSVITTVFTKEEHEDRQTMERLGLKSYRVSEYLREIASFRQGLWDLIEEEEEGDHERTPAWI